MFSMTNLRIGSDELPQRESTHVCMCHFKSASAANIVSFINYTGGSFLLLASDILDNLFLTYVRNADKIDARISMLCLVDVPYKLCTDWTLAILVPATNNRLL